MDSPYSFPRFLTRPRECRYFFGIDPRIARNTWSVLAMPAMLCLAYLVRRTLFVFVLALMFAYLLFPVVDALDRLFSRKRRSHALAVPFILILILLGVSGVAIAHQAQKEAEQFRSSSTLRDFEKRVAALHPLGIPVGEQIASISRQIVEHSNDILVMMPQMGLGHRVLTLSRGLLDCLIIPILSFFILRDGPGIRDSTLEVFGFDHESVGILLADAHRLMLQYMRALLLLCLITLGTFSVALTLLGVRYAILLSSIAFALEFIPLAGPLAAGILIVGIAYVSGYPHPLWWIAALLGAYRVVLDYVISPLVMKKGVELHPLLVLFGVFSGGEIAGIAGMFLSVPVLALARLICHEIRNRRHREPARKFEQIAEAAAS